MNLYQYITSHKEQKNIFVKAQGGSGKTTQLRYIESKLIERAKKGEKIVPIYVDVKLLNEESNLPIYKYIIDFCKFPPNTETDSFFQSQYANFGYTFYLLVDCLNEAPYQLQKSIISNIKLLKRAEGVNIIITSRSKKNSEVFDSFKYLELEGLNYEVITSYLSKRFGQHVERERFNQSLIKILQVPLYLKTFADTYVGKRSFPDLYNNKTVRRADLLNAYLDKLITDLNSDNSILTNTDNTRFMVEYYIPAFAFQMALKNKLRFTDDEYEKYEKVLTKDYFDKFFSKLDIQKGKSMPKNLTPLVNMVEQFALFSEQSSENRCTYIIHETWRDLLAAKYIVEIIEKSKRFDELEETVNQNIQRFVGELVKTKDELCECDFEDKTDIKDEKSPNSINAKPSPIEVFMQKNYELLNQHPLAIRNLVEIMKISRNSKITANYSNLNLTLCSFQNTIIFNSMFIMSDITENTFIPQGHINKVEQCYITQGGRYLLSIDSCNTAYIWNLSDESSRMIFLEQMIPYYYFNYHIDWHNLSVIASSEKSFLISLHFGEDIIAYIEIYCSSHTFKIHKTLPINYSKMIIKKRNDDFPKTNIINIGNDKYIFETDSNGRNISIARNGKTILKKGLHEFGYPKCFDLQSNTIVCSFASSIIIWKLPTLNQKILNGYSYPTTNQQKFKINSNKHTKKEESIVAGGFSSCCVCFFNFKKNKIEKKIYFKGTNIEYIYIIPNYNILVALTDFELHFFDYNNNEFLYTIAHLSDFDKKNVCFFRNNEIMVLSEKTKTIVYELSYTSSFKCEKKYCYYKSKEQQDMLNPQMISYDNNSNCIFILEENVGKSNFKLINICCTTWEVKTYYLKTYYYTENMHFFSFNDLVYIPVISSFGDQVHILKSTGKTFEIDDIITCKGSPIHVYIDTPKVNLIEIEGNELSLYEFDILTKEYKRMRKVDCSQIDIDRIKKTIYETRRKACLLNDELPQSERVDYSDYTINSINNNFEYNIDNNSFFHKEFMGRIGYGADNLLLEMPPENILNDYNVIPIGILGCDLSSVNIQKTNDSEQKRFFNIIYFNGGKVPRDYIPIEY